MAGSIEQVEREIAALDQMVAGTAEELRQGYQQYLQVLGTAARQQMILACYHLCTQGYPERFLRLSFSQRQQMQQRLRQIGQQMQQQLIAQLDRSQNEADRKEIRELEAGWVAILEAAAAEEDAELLVEESESLDEPEDEETTPPQASETEQPPEPLTPQRLTQWQQDLERAIARTLQQTSREANRLLKESGVLPKQLPEPILEAAAKTDALDSGSSPPNLMTMVVEAIEAVSADGVPKKDAPIPESMGGGLKLPLKIMAVQLRLVEIEFADSKTMAARHKLRDLLARLKSIKREYQKKQQERAIAQAEAAWRSSWFED